MERYPSGTDYPIRAALSNGLLPVIHGDVAFDEIRGGTILSTEDLFAHLAHQLHPQRILLAGLEAGVWADFPAHKHLLAEITPGSFAPACFRSRSGHRGRCDGRHVLQGYRNVVPGGTDPRPGSIDFLR